MEYSNAQKLASVLTEWSRPAISQIAVTKLMNLSFLQSAQRSLISSGLVGMNYKVANDLMPFFSNSIDKILQPMLEGWLGKMPDSSLPSIAHSVVDSAMEQPKFSILDGLVEFEQNDIIELKDLLDKNLPLVASEGYHIIK